MLQAFPVGVQAATGGRHREQRKGGSECHRPSISCRSMVDDAIAAVERTMRAARRAQESCRREPGAGR